TTLSAWSVPVIVRAPVAETRLAVALGRSRRSRRSRPRRGPSRPGERRARPERVAGRGRGAAGQGGPPALGPPGEGWGTGPPHQRGPALRLRWAVAGESCQAAAHFLAARAGPPRPSSAGEPRGGELIWHWRAAILAGEPTRPGAAVGRALLPRDQRQPARPPP